MPGSYHATVLELVSSTHFAGMEGLMIGFFAKKNNHFQDQKDFSCKIQTIPVLGKDFPS